MIIKEDISSLEDYFKQFVREIHLPRIESEVA